MPSILIKPMSVNRAWQGKRFKTKEYKQYERDVMTLLPMMNVPNGDLRALYEFGVSSKLCDWDNPIKPFQDILQKKYGFDDRRIVDAQVRKRLVKRGEEYIYFELHKAA